MLLRTARELLEQDVSSRRVREALLALRDQLPVSRPLSAVHVSAVGDTVLVRDDEGVWEPDTGQLRMDLDVVPTVPGEPATGSSLTLDGPRPASTADDWFDTALDLEAISVEQAIEAYRRALEVDGGHADAHLNLGRLLHESGEVAAAERHYRAAADLDPSSGRPRFNLGVALEDQSRPEAAIEAYEEALRLDPDLAGAHFNLSRLLEASGEAAGAISHLVEYRRLVERGA